MPYIWDEITLCTSTEQGQLWLLVEGQLNSSLQWALGLGRAAMCWAACEQHTQQIEGCVYSSLSGTCEAKSGVLCLDLGSPVQQKHYKWEILPEGHQEDYKVGGHIRNLS